MKRQVSFFHKFISILLALSLIFINNPLISTLYANNDIEKSLQELIKKSHFINPDISPDFTHQTTQLHKYFSGEIKKHPYDFFKLVPQEVNAQPIKRHMLKKRKALFLKELELIEELKENLTTYDSYGNNIDESYFTPEMIKELLIDITDSELRKQYFVIPEDKQLIKITPNLNPALNLIDGISMELTPKIIQLKDELFSLKQKSKLLDLKIDKIRISLTERVARSINYKKIEVELFENSQGFYLHQMNVPILKVNIPVRDIVVYENYIIFIEKDSEIYNGTQNISVIDLKYYKKALGRTRLPIFSLPLPIETSIGSLKIENGSIEFLDTNQKMIYKNFTLEKSLVEALINPQILVCNIIINMLDPKTYENSVDLIGEFSQIFVKALSLGGKTLFENEENLKKFDSTILTLKENLEEELIKQQNIKKIKTVTIEDLNKKQTATEMQLEKHLFAGITNKFNALFDKKITNPDEALQEIKTNLGMQRKLTTRMGLLWHKLTTHRPLGVPKIYQSLAMIAGGLLKPWEKEGINKIKTAMVSLSKHPYFRISATAAISATLGEFIYPEGMHIFYAKTFELGHGIFDFFYGKANDLKYLFGVSTKASFHGYWVPNLISRYWEDKYKIAVAIGGMMTTVYVTCGIPHLIANTLLLARDLKLKEIDWKLNDPEINSLSRELMERENKRKARLEKFIKRQEGERSNLLTLQGQGLKEQAKRRNEVMRSVDSFGDDDNYWVQEFLNQKKEAAEKKIFFRLKNTMINSKYVPPFMKNWLTTKTKPNHEITSFGSALGHFLISYASFNNTIKIYTKMWWDGYFLFRSFFPAFHPMLFSYFISHPKYLYTAMRAFHDANGNLTSGKVSIDYNIPTKLNGGQDLITKTLGDLFYRLGATFSNREHVPESVTQYFASKNNYLDQLKKWEEKIMIVEKEVIKLATKKASTATMKYISDNSELIKLSEEGGITDISDRVFKNKKTISYFRIYFDTLFNLTMEKYLLLLFFQNASETFSDKLNADFNLNKTEDIIKFIEVVSSDFANIELDPEIKSEIQKIKSSKGLSKFDVMKLRDSTLKLVNQINIRPEVLCPLMEKIIKTNDIHNFALTETNKIASPKKIITNFDYGMLYKLNPEHNMQIKKVLKIRQKMDDPLAVMRASQHTITQLIADKPMELLTLFMCLAGITDKSDMLYPIQDEMFGPNSFFFASRYSFIYGYLSGVITGMFANPGVKIQMDMLHDTRFGEVPVGYNAKKGFTRYYLTQFQNPDNSMWANHKHNVEIITTNLKAAFINISLMHLATMGRIEIDSFTMGYLISYLTPLMAFASKIEQSFELATPHLLREVPETLRTHPEILDWYNKEFTKTRFRYSIINKLYENVESGLLGNFMVMNTEKLGPRSFAKIMLGETPAGYLDNATQKIINISNEHGVPLIAGAVDKCRWLFLNNHPYLKK